MCANMVFVQFQNIKLSREDLFSKRISQTYIFIQIMHYRLRYCQARFLHVFKHEVSLL